MAPNKRKRRRKATATEQTAAPTTRAAAKATTKKPAAPKAPRALMEKADPIEVGKYFDGTGLTRKQIAAAVGVSTSVIATVQNPKGDRWSADRFSKARVLIDKYAKAHAPEIAAAREHDRKKAQETAERVARRAAKKTGKSPAKASAKAAPVQLAPRRRGRPPKAAAEKTGNRRPRAAKAS